MDSWSLRRVEILSTYNIVVSKHLDSKPRIQYNTIQYVRKTRKKKVTLDALLVMRDDYRVKVMCRKKKPIVGWLGEWLARLGSKSGTYHTTY